jgi:hypothetical protein
VHHNSNMIIHILANIPQKQTGNDSHRSKAMLV